MLTAIVLVTILLIETASVFPHPYEAISKIAIVLIVMYMLVGLEDK